MNKKSLITFTLFALFSIAAYADGHISKAPDGAAVYFIEPADGQTVEGAVSVKFGLKGMGVAPAGIEKENTGHHHLLINTDISSVDMSAPLPANDNIKHFGGGQTETMVELPSGQHTLQLLLGNYAHVPHATPVMSEKITITVK